MNKPEMILFDWGNTLADGEFDGVAGTRAVLERSHNPHGCSAEEIQQFADTMSRDFGRIYGYNTAQPVIEVHDFAFQNYLYEYFGISSDMSNEQIEDIFWNNAFSVSNTAGIEAFLKFLASQSIRTGIISNISVSGKALKRRIDSCLPENEFEFVLASSEYVYRKPHPRIFELAARKAGLKPSQIWYCGDNVQCDIIGAHNAGFTPVWYKGAVHSEQTPPDIDCIQIDNWEELKQILLTADTIRQDFVTV